MAGIDGVDPDAPDLGRDVSDELFARLRQAFDDDALVEFPGVIAWENASSKFNRALRIPSQALWQRASST